MGEYTGTVPTFLSGELPDSDKFDELTDLATALTAAWSTWTPTWTAFTTNPSVGDATVVARYRRIGKTIDGTIRLIMGSSTTFGSGAWRFSLPGGVSLPTSAEYTCAIWMYDDNLTNRHVGVGRITGSTIEPHTAALGATNGQVTSAAPFTWATSDQIALSFTFECA